MKKASLIPMLVAAAVISAAPAIAKTSITKGHKVCEDAAEKQEPAPKSVRADRDKTTSSDAVITVLLKVKNADDSSATLTCKVDRETGAATLAPAT
jgi:hypothetical protein